ncbi:MAG: hypothetical protein HYV59_00515 [Planctomycetes bacterium]|nr:hypothetical protein [Planctomycetota bacterium]
MFNSLSQALLKITSPGIPDFYQGTDLWDFCLVDPDNRRLVDYGLRIKMLEELKKREQEMSELELAGELVRNMEDGRIKLYLTYKILNYRKNNRTLFENVEYSPLEVKGDKTNNVCSFLRKLGDSVVLVVVPRFSTNLMQLPERLPFGKDVWKDSHVVIPFEETGISYRNIFTGENVNTVRQNDLTVLYLSETFANFPVALMERIV